MCPRRISKRFPGFFYLNSRQEVWFKKLLKRDRHCVCCGTKKNLQPHHIIPCNVYNDIYYDTENGAILCKSCHDRYHKTCFPINKQTFNDFVKNKKQTNFQSKKRKNKKKKRKRTREYSLKKYEHHPNYSKIRINDFREKIKVKKKKPKRKRKRKRLNPIFLCKKLGSDAYDYSDKVSLEKEVLGEFYEN